MKSLVIELQQEALKPTSSISHLLRLTLAIACKLKLSDLECWVEEELNGYTEDAKAPLYRNVQGVVKFFNLYYGWRAVTFESPKEHDIFSKRIMSQPIGQLEDLIKTNEGSAITIYYPPEVELFLQNGLRSRAKVTLFVSPSQIHGILDAVRNKILKQALKLEELGILGENMTFSDTEKERSVNSATTIYNIQNQMVLNSPQDSCQIQQGCNSSTQTISGISEEALINFIEKIQTRFSELALNSQEETDVKAYVATLEAQLKVSKPHSSIIKTTLCSIQNILEGAVSSGLSLILLESLKTLI